jgi:hypothetical protein
LLVGEPLPVVVGGVAAGAGCVVTGACAERSTFAVGVVLAGGDWLATAAFADEAPCGKVAMQFGLGRVA